MAFPPGPSKQAVADYLNLSRLTGGIVIGLADAAAPVAQTLGVQSVVAGTANTAGANFTIAGSKSTGSAAGGSIIFQTAAAGGSGSTQNALATRLMISSTGVLSAGANFSPTFLPNTATGNWEVARFDDATINLTLGYDGTLRGIILNSTGGLAWGSSGVGTADLYLRRDAANTLALRNSTTAQTFNSYRTWTDAANNEFLSLTTDGNGFLIQSKHAGSGTSRDLTLMAGQAADGAVLRLGTANSSRWNIDGNGHFLAGTDNTYDIGASGSTRPRTLYVGTSVITPALRIDQAPAANTSAATTITNGADSTTNCGHRLSINMNGTTYWIPCSASAF